jgi:hypothetical protein
MTPTPQKIPFELNSNQEQLLLQLLRDQPGLPEDDMASRLYTFLDTALRAATLDYVRAFKAAQIETQDAQSN